MSGRCRLASKLLLQRGGPDGPAVAGGLAVVTVVRQMLYI